MPRQAHQRSHHRSGWRCSPPWRFFYPARGHQALRSGCRLSRRRIWTGRLDVQLDQELGGYAGMLEDQSKKLGQLFAEVRHHEAGAGALARRAADRRKRYLSGVWVIGGILLLTLGILLFLYTR